ncbi:MAG: bifunctional phosphoribosyl-AMP cyclohydrolase/phosphoribosyl-ATP diphosphatase HisIE [Dethiobacter sp.]|nr:bifunctional phosphoribosyl-AMP cyclohydrolase/phosphoribosyl-ATP diphosphatase HisIE [Dethiobacter sp.]
MNEIKFDQAGLVPAIVQDWHSGQVLMLAYMNREALQKTLESGETWFYSRSRNELWHKGETSGHFQQVRRISYDCDGDALLVQVEQTGAACHTGAAGCFFRTLQAVGTPPAEHFLAELERIISQRKVERPEGSYVVKLLEAGVDRILKKVAEEAGEVIIAAKNEDRAELVYETGDLLFHLLVLLARQDVALSEVLAELARRHR